MNKRNKAIILPGFRRVFTFEYPIENLSRGEHIFKVTIRTGDTLGLVEKEKGHKNE